IQLDGSRIARIDSHVRQLFGLAILAVQRFSQPQILSCQNGGRKRLSQLKELGSKCILDLGPGSLDVRRRLLNADFALASSFHNLVELDRVCRVRAGVSVCGKKTRYASRNW